MSENNKQQSEFFLQIKKELLQQYRNKNYVSRHFIHRKARHEYKKLRSGIREFVKNINNSLKQNGKNNINLDQISEKLYNLKKAALVLRLGKYNDDILKNGRLNMLLNSSDPDQALEQIEKNSKWGYKTDQIYIKNDKINTKKGKSYIEPAAIAHRNKLKRSKTWKILYDLETKIILKFQNNLFEKKVNNENKKIEPKNVISFALNGSKPKIKNNSDSEIENINEKSNNENKKIEPKNVISFTFDENEPGIKQGYFSSIYNDKTSNIEKFSKALNGFISILKKCVEVLSKQTKYKENDLKRIKKYVRILDGNMYFDDNIYSEEELLDYRNIVYIINGMTKDNYGNSEYAIKKFSEKIENLGNKMMKYQNKKNIKIFTENSIFFKTIHKIFQIMELIFDSLQKKEQELINS